MDISEYLKELAGKEEVLFFPNPGNAGDSVIAWATFQIFSKAGIRYKIVPRTSAPPAGRIVFCGGGGGWVSDSGHPRAVVELCHKKAKKMIILPSTITKNTDLLNQLGGNVEIFCRERTSYEHVRTSVSGAKVFLAEDLAFFMDVEDISFAWPESLFQAFMSELLRVTRTNWERRKAPPTVKQLKRFLRREKALFRLRSANSNGVLNCFRTDREKTELALPEDNIDLSRFLSFGVFNETVSFLVTDQMLRFLRQYETIRTNRLHIAIVSALLDKKVDFYPNSYYKNKAVFEHSLKKRSGKVVWKGD